MTLASIIHPNWVSYTVTSPAGDTVYDTIGLHRRCSSTTNKCVPFPDPARCPGRGGGGSSGGGRASFCAMWRTTGFLMSFAVVAQLAAAVGFLITMAGGRVKRHGGWRLLAGALLVVAAAQFLGMAVVVGCLRFIHTYLPPSFDSGDVGALTGHLFCRRISLTTTTSSWCRAIGWTRRGICARPVRPSRCWRRVAWPSRRLCCRPRTDTCFWVILVGFDCVSIIDIWRRGGVVVADSDLGVERWVQVNHDCFRLAPYPYVAQAEYPVDAVGPTMSLSLIHI